MIFTLENLKQIFPLTKIEIIEQFIIPLNQTIDKFEINTNLRISAFIAQIGHESQGLTHIQENLNYSKDGLRKVFPKYFPTDDMAIQYARQPEKIANRVYANRMGNGNESSGDGWKYKGRGLIQLTGKYTYQQFSDYIKILEIVPYLETPEGASMSAGWYWWKNNLNILADKEDIVKITKKINGGTIGLEDRKKLYELAKNIIQENPL
jgi:putative chitinase